VSDFSELYSRHAPDVYRFALYLSGNRHEAEDVTSETFVRAWTATVPIRTATAKGYLLTIARNLFLQRLSRRSRHVALDDQLRDPRASTEARAEQNSELQVALAALQRLPEGDRAALVMRALDELPYEEIARALQISLSAAKVRVHRARLALADIRLEWQTD
jgi:RNA polymerase sigma-70 factor, ECF subfamily